MKETIHGVACNLKIEGQGRPVILLHGWGQNQQMMDAIHNHLKTGFQCVNMDLPGFGQSDCPPQAWDVKEYCEFVHELCEKYQLENPILIGHSFGGRISLLYATMYPVYKMILTGAAGIKPKRGLDYHIRTKTYKLGKKLVQLTGSKTLEEQLKQHFGSSDYKNANPILREILVRHVNVDFTDLLPQIKTPTLLVWGDEDEQTPIWMGKLMEEKMVDAGLAIFEHDGHFAYFHQADRFNRVLDAFIGKDRS